MPETTPRSPYDSASQGLSYSHFSDLETKTQRGDKNCPRLHGIEVVTRARTCRLAFADSRVCMFFLYGKNIYQPRIRETCPKEALILRATSTSWGVWGFTLEHRPSRHSDTTSPIPCLWQTLLIKYNTLSHKGQTQVSSPQRAPAITNGSGFGHKAELDGELLKSRDV